MARASLAVAAGVIVSLGLAVAPASAQEDPAQEDTAQEATAAQTWSVQPADDDGADDRPNWDYELEPGTSVDDVAQVNNFSDEPVTFRVYSHDAINAPDGGFTLQPADVEPAEVGAWIGLDEEVTVEPGDSAQVPFTLSVPEDAMPGDHAGGIVASITTETTDAEGQRVLVDNRVGSRVYLRVAGAVDPVLAVTGMDVQFERSWVPFSTGTASVTYDIENVGNVRLSGEQTLTGHGLFGLGDHTVTLDGIDEVLPGDSVTVTTQVEDIVPLFRLTEEAAVNPQPPETGSADVIPAVQATAAVGVWAVPWTEVIILGVLILGVAWSLWRRRRRKQQTATMMDDALAKAREEVRQELQNATSAVASVDDSPEETATKETTTDEALTGEETATEEATTDEETATEEATTDEALTDEEDTAPSDAPSR